MFRNTLLAATSALALALVISGPAAAQDVHDWSGSYFGVKLGGTFGDAEFSGVPNTTLDSDGFTIGIMSGYNFQSGHWVFGYDSDSSFATIDESRGLVGTETKYIGTTRARVGYAFDTFLPYVTGGIASAYVDDRVGAVSDSQFLFGYSVGGGLEMALADGWYARAEYLYVDFQDERISGTGARIDHDQHLIRVGISMDTDWVFDSLFGN